MNDQIIMEREETTNNDNILDHKTESGSADINDGPQVTVTPDSSPPPALVIPPVSSQNGNCDKIPNQDQTPSSDQGSNNNDDKAQAVAASKRRVRFSVCEYITETLVHENGVNGSHSNPSFENEESDGKDSPNMESGGSKVRYIGGKLRRDSVHPLVPYHPSQANDHWDVTLPDASDDEKGGGVPWSDLSTKDKIFRVLIGIGKFIGLLALLYFFVCSLDLLSLGFRLLGGSTAGEIFRKSSILQNPVVGLMLGILTTVLVQSSSTSTSILVGMVASGFMDVRMAIPPIMGANIGTSITNTIVSFTQAGDRNQFRRAFAGATVLDMFNWITVIVLLPVEVIFGYLYHVSKATVDLLIPDSQSGGEIQILSVITNPFVDLIVQLNDTVLECWATPNCTDADDASLIKEYCSTSKTQITFQERVVDLSGKEILNVRDVAVQNDLQKCDFLFAGTRLSDAAVGAIVLVSSLLVLCFCLVMIVKLLNSVLQGHVSTIIKHTLNANIPYVPWLTGYIAILIGAVMTFLVQSSSVFTSALTPLVGLGVISLNRVYPLTLGANIGTTTTALLASMAAEGKALHPSLQIALCHFFFNITGVILFYPIPFLRFPIGMAKVLGNITAKYRWFAIFYLVSMFGVLPLLFISLSLAGSIYVVVLVSIICSIVILVALLTLLQRKVPHILPVWLRDWKWMPLPMRSLKPYDNLVSKMPCCRSKTQDDSDNSDDEDTYSGKSNVDGDFVFLTGNKIPPPSDYGSNPRAIITRIVPTRVIRNISNVDYPHKNGTGKGGSNGYTNQSSENSTQLSSVPRPTSIGNGNSNGIAKVGSDNQLSPMQNDHHQTGNGENESINNNATNNSNTLSNNTLPVPSSLEESLPQASIQSEPPKEASNVTNNYTNGAYTNSAESFLV